MEIKDKIISNSGKLFFKYGIRNITMDAIAEDLGISKRTIYENFKDKDELLTYCLEANTLEQNKIVDEILNNSENLIEALIKIIKHNVNTLKLINPVFYFDVQKYYYELFEVKIKKNRKKNLTRISDILNRGIQEKIFRSEINVEIVALLILEQFKMMGNQEIFPENKFSKVEIFENIAINFIRGLATNEGLIMLGKYNS
jgi:AcrR family transcriptional regulator